MLSNNNLGGMVESRIGDTLFVKGHIEESGDRSYVAICFDGGDQVAVSEVNAALTVNDLMGNTILHCQKEERQVSALAFAAPLEDGGWACFSSDNDMEAAGAIYLPWDNEGMQDWHKLAVPASHSMMAPAAECAAAVWIALVDAGVAQVAKGKLVEEGLTVDA